MLPQRPYTVISGDIIGKDILRMDYFNHYKTMQIPIAPFNKFPKGDFDIAIRLPWCVKKYIEVKKTKRQMELKNSKGLARLRVTRRSTRIKKLKTFGRCRELVEFDGWYQQHGSGRKLSAIKQDAELPVAIKDIVKQPKLQKTLLNYISRNQR